MGAVVIDWTRLNWKIKLADLVRQEENRGVAAHVYFAIYFAIACLATMFFFPKMVAIAALLMLCIGDSLVGLLGVILFLFRCSGRADVSRRFGGGRIMQDNARLQGVGSSSQGC